MCALFWLAPTLTHAQQQPLTLAEVSDLVKGRVLPERILSLAREQCVSFAVDERVISTLRAAGADPAFAESLRTVCYPGPVLTVVSAPAGVAVRINGNNVGTAPWTSSMAEEVEALVEVQRGGSIQRSTVPLAHGQTTRIEFVFPSDTLEWPPLPTINDVVSKRGLAPPAVAAPTLRQPHAKRMSLKWLAMPPALGYVGWLAVNESLQGSATNDSPDNDNRKTIAAKSLRGAVGGLALGAIIVTVHALTRRPDKVLSNEDREFNAAAEKAFALRTAEARRLWLAGIPSTNAFQEETEAAQRTRERIAALNQQIRLQNMSAAQLKPKISIQVRPERK